MAVGQQGFNTPLERLAAHHPWQHPKGLEHPSRDAF
jgi:hypothetical protein